MKGFVKIINPRLGLCAVKIEGSGEYTVLELLDSEIGQDDLLVGDLQSILADKLWNKTRAEFIQVYVQNTHCSFETAKKACLLI
jgi:hypothetical protein